MKSTLFRIICRLLAVAIFALPFRPASAGMIGTDEAVVASAAQADRAAIVSAVSRADVARQLQSLGVDPEDVKTRVAAMTDSEARALAGQIASAPAGANVSGWVVALVLVVVLWALYAYR